MLLLMAKKNELKSRKHCVSCPDVKLSTCCCLPAAVSCVRCWMNPVQCVCGPPLCYQQDSGLHSPSQPTLYQYSTCRSRRTRLSSLAETSRCASAARCYALRTKQKENKQRASRSHNIAPQLTSAHPLMTGGRRRRRGEEERKSQQVTYQSCPPAPTRRRRLITGQTSLFMQHHNQNKALMLHKLRC